MTTTVTCHTQGWRMDDQLTIRMVSDISHAKCERFARHFDAKRNFKPLDGEMYLRNETSNTWMARRTLNMGVRHSSS